MGAWWKANFYEFTVTAVTEPVFISAGTDRAFSSPIGDILTRGKRTFRQAEPSGRRNHGNLSWRRGCLDSTASVKSRLVFDFLVELAGSGVVNGGRSRKERSLVLRERFDS